MTRGSSIIIRKGHPYSYQDYKICGHLVAKLSVVEAGLWWLEVSGTIPLGMLPKEPNV